MSEATDITDFQRDVARPVKAWAPHGVVVRLMSADHLKQLRRLVPGVPFVSTLVSPPGLVDACVVTDTAEAISLARDHYRERGLPHLALFCCASPPPARAAAALAVHSGFRVHAGRAEFHGTGIRWRIGAHRHEQTHAGAGLQRRTRRRSGQDVRRGEGHGDKRIRLRQI